MTKPFSILVLLTYFCAPLFAQHQDEKVDFRSVIISTEQKFNVAFSYADENIDGVFLVPPSDNLNLIETLQYLREQTSLQFKQLNRRHIAIIKTVPSSRDVCGVIIDGENGEYIAGATIQSANSGAVSDEKGSFILKNILFSDTLHIRFVGFASLDLPIDKMGGSRCDTIYLRQKTIKLHEIIVANFIAKGININSDGSIKISPKTMGILPGLTDPDVLQTMQALPGIQSINETVSDINVRGGTNDQNLILWEGIKMYQSGHFFGLISAFNPYLTNSVELVKNGTTSAMSDGVSSTIDIRSDDELSQNISGGAGINMLNADLYFKFPIAKKISLQLSGRRSISDIVQTPTYTQYFNRIFRNTDVTNSADPVADSLVGTDERFNFHDISAKLLYDITPRDKLRLNFLRVFNSIHYAENALVDNKPETKTSGLDQQSMVYGLFYSRSWSPTFLTTAQVYYSGYELGAINFDVFNDQRLIQENKVVDTGLKLDARLALSNAIDFFMGYQFAEIGVSNLVDINNPPFRRYTKKVLRNHALVAEGNFSSASNATNLRVGLRTYYFEKFNLFNLAPRLAFTQRLVKHVYFEILGEMKSQTTTQIIDFQNDFLGVENRRWVLANNKDIPIVKSKQISTGLRYQPGNLLISLEGYLKQVDGITSSSQGFQNQFQYIRTNGSYRVSGLEFLINQRIGEFNAWLSYSYANNMYSFHEFVPSVFPNNLDIRHTITVGSSYQIKHFQLSAGVNWRTGKPMTMPSGIVDGNITYPEPNSSRLDDYLRIDLSAKYLFKISNQVGGEIGASVWNLLDNQNILNTYFQVDQNNNLETIQQYALGFTPNIMFRISF